MENIPLRYRRQIIMPEFGETGQKRLSGAKVFIAGAGGLGSVSAYYLAAAGVGKLIIADMDVVTEENLNRQILHRTADISRPKVVSARERLTDLNPLCSVRTIHDRIRADNVFELVEDAQIMIDATDNIQTRKILNRASIRKRIPFIHGGIHGFNGMVTTFVPGKTPCFECIFPNEGKPAEKVGVIGPTAGIIASIQSMEALKILLGIEGGLTGKLLIVDGIEMTFKQIPIGRNPECAVCGRIQV